MHSPVMEGMPELDRDGAETPQCPSCGAGKAADELNEEHQVLVMASHWSYGMVVTAWG